MNSATSNSISQSAAAKDAALLPDGSTTTEDVVYEVQVADHPVVVQVDTDKEPAPRRHRPRRVWLPVILFSLTCVTTWFAGACRWMPLDHLIRCVTGQPISLDGSDYFSAPFSFMPLRQIIYSHWREGLMYMLGVQSMLLAHEMGHYVFTLIYRVRATLPIFLPVPILPTGTMGAVIAMEGQKADRRQIFDIGIAGPLAGLAVTIPLLWIGILQLDLTRPPSGGLAMDLPLVIRWSIDWMHPGKLTSDNLVWLGQANPWFFAGWFGLLMTALNMMPVSQLDGGHITYTLWGKGAHWVARGFMLFVFAYITYSGNLAGILMAVLVMFIGTDHPPTSDDRVPLGWGRTILGYASLAIPVLCFAPRFFVM